MTRRAVAIYTLPLIAFFVLNALTPVWWDDFIMACRFDGWYEPHSALAASFSDVWDSTVNMYRTWHGRSVVDFLNFLFMSIQTSIPFSSREKWVYTMESITICMTESSRSRS